jgi:hypothetical protein
MNMFFLKLFMTFLDGLNLIFELNRLVNCNMKIQIES